LWAFPDTTIAAGGYLIVWADSRPKHKLHTSFVLSNSSETLLLTKGTTIIGRTSYDITFDLRFAEKTYARLPNGTGDYALQAPSFNVSNGDGFSENLTTTGLVVNEIVPVNLTVKADQEGGYDDFIELFNNSSSTVNLSDYYLSDDATNPSKWPFPSGTIIAAGGYLIVWADNDYIDGYGCHASFQLDAKGETILLTDGLKIIDKVTYGHATADLGYSRVPNGKGDFYWQAATYKKTNGTTIPVNEEIVTDIPEQEFVVSHSRNNQQLTVSLGNDETKKITIYSITAAVQYSGVINGTLSIPTSDWKNGVYLVSIGNKEKVKKVVVLK
ncbi:MAG TPA: lamin tail domain-containing protein, partial [Bacteroidales bacterium]